MFIGILATTAKQQHLKSRAKPFFCPQRVEKVQTVMLVVMVALEVVQVPQLMVVGQKMKEMGEATAMMEGQPSEKIAQAVVKVRRPERLGIMVANCSVVEELYLSSW